MAFKSMLSRKGVKILSSAIHTSASPNGELMEAIVECMDKFDSDNLSSLGAFVGVREPPGCKQRPWELHLVEGGV